MIRLFSLKWVVVPTAETLAKMNEKLQGLDHEAPKLSVENLSEVPWNNPSLSLLHVADFLSDFEVLAAFAFEDESDWPVAWTYTFSPKTKSPKVTAALRAALSLPEEERAEFERLLALHRK